MPFFSSMYCIPQNGKIYFLIYQSQTNNFRPILLIFCGKLHFYSIYTDKKNYAILPAYYRNIQLQRGITFYRGDISISFSFSLSVFLFPSPFLTPFFVYNYSPLLSFSFFVDTVIIHPCYPGPKSDPRVLVTEYPTIIF